MLEQSASPSLATQLSAAAVSWRASCRRIVPLGLTQTGNPSLDPEESESFTFGLVFLLVDLFRAKKPAVKRAAGATAKEKQAS